MKGKKFIVIMAIFIILCSIQVISAFEDNNITQADVQPIESDTLEVSDVITIDKQYDESKVQNNDMDDNDLEVSNSVVSSSAPHDYSVLNPKQSLSGSGNVKDLNFSGDPTLFNLTRFIFRSVCDDIKSDMDDGKNPTLEWNIYLNNNTFTGGYGDGKVSTLNTGYLSTGTNERATYITFRNYDPQTRQFGENLDITINLYGGRVKDDGLTSTVDLSRYGADYRFIDLSGGSSTITGVNFKNFDVNNYKNTLNNTSMPFIFFGDDKIQNNKSSLINCTFENITLNKKQPLVRMAYIDSPQDSSVISETGGIIEGCVFRDNHASQMIAIAGSKSDSYHSDGGPIFYGFEASNNRFENNRGTMEQNSNTQSLGLCMKIWNEAFNVTLNNNSFVNNTNALYGAAYCINGFNATITNNYFEGNEAVFGACIEALNGNITIKNCTFINNVAKGNHTQHPYRDGSGAGIALLGCNNYISNCTFINNTAHGHAGAIDIVGGIKKRDGIEYYLVANNTTIEHSRFFDNLALDYAGGVHVNGTNTLIDNCTFERNNASFAGAVRLIGENSTIFHGSFTKNYAVKGNGGAIAIDGPSANIILSDFDENEAIKGGAFYLNGNKTNIIDSNFTYNRAIQGGAVYIGGKNNVISNSYFNYNNATYSLRVDVSKNKDKTKGGAIYIGGENNVIDNSKFEGNVASATNDTAVIVQTTPGLLGAYLDVTGVGDDGLGGAIFIGANGNNITSNEFGNNIARNGSAVYNDASGTYFKGGLFIKNQAWSYVLEVNGTNKTYCKDNIINKIYYGANVEIKLYNYIAGDNILNGIYNARNVGDVTFKDVGYIIDNDVGQVKKTLFENITPELGAQEGVLYQDSLERYQQMVITVRCNETGEIVANKKVFTDLYGNYSFVLVGLNSGNYTIVAYHPEDMNYRHIITANIFEVIKVNSTLDVGDMVFDYNSTGSVNVSFENAIGIMANVVGHSQAIISINGTIISVSNLSAGNYILNVTTVVDDNHNSVTKTANITVNKINSTLTVNDIVVDYGTPTNITVTTEGATGIIAKIDGKNITVKGNTIIIPILDVGNYTLTVTAIGDENHNNITKNATVTVNKVKTQITAESITTTYNVDKELIITLTDSNGKPITNTTLTVDLNGAKTYATDINGRVKVSTNALAPKTYNAKITFAGNSTYNGSSKDIQVTVIKATPKITAKKKTYRVNKKSKKFTITLKDNTGKPIKNAKVRLIVKKIAKKSKKKSSNKKSKSDKKKNFAKTNNKGKATFKVLNNKKGKYKAKVKFYGDQYYNKTTKTVKIVIK